MIFPSPILMAHVFTIGRVFVLFLLEEASYETLAAIMGKHTVIHTRCDFLVLQVYEFLKSKDKNICRVSWLEQLPEEILILLVVL